MVLPSEDLPYDEADLDLLFRTIGHFIEIPFVNIHGRAFEAFAHHFTKPPGKFRTKLHRTEKYSLHSHSR